MSDAGRPSITLISTMKQLILHHHDPSPFAEKIRLVFGRKREESPFHDCESGDDVIVVPDDYGFDPVQGRLHTLNTRKIAVERNDAKLGDTVVPFPRIDYRVDAA